MTPQQAAHIKEWFDRYVQRYAQDGALHPMQELKLRHSYHVAKDAEAIARAEGWPECDIEAARMLGLVHDVGRFSQFAEFQSFYDPDTIDHGERGFTVLAEENVLAQCRPEVRASILKGVSFHNDRYLPEELSVEERRFVLLIRDSDKLDIYRVILEAIETGTILEHPTLLWGTAPDQPPSAHMLDLLLKKEPISYTEVTCLADYLLVLMGWIFDVQFPATRRLLRERKIYERLRSHLPADNPRIDEILQMVQAERDRD